MKFINEDREKGKRTKQNVITSTLDQAHHYIMEALEKVHVSSKKLAIDTTLGNGYDTCFLAQMVGTDGAVIGCDIQKSAIQATALALANTGLEARVKLLQCGHQFLHEHLPDTWKGEVAAITANLGYLPRGDKTIITKPDTTKRMIETVLPFLCVNGVMAIVAYGGHAGGQEEVDVVRNTLRLLPQQDYRVLNYTFINQTGTPPELFVVERVN